MKVQVGAEVGDRMLKVEVDEVDAQRTFGEKWEGWNTSRRFTMLSTYADSLVVKYLADAHLITSDMAKSRMAALQEIMNG